MVRHHLNIKFYALCRFKLKVEVKEVQNEIEQLFGSRFLPPLNTTISWSKFYIKHKKILSEIFVYSKCDTLKFNIDKNQTKKKQRVQFYSLCRYELGTNPQSVITETNLVFKNSLDLATLNRWILNLCKEAFNVQHIEIDEKKDEQIIKQNKVDQSSKSTQTNNEVKLDLDEFQIKTSDEISKLNNENKRLKNEDAKSRVIIDGFSKSSNKFQTEAMSLKFENAKLIKELKYLFNSCKQSNASNLEFKFNNINLR